MPVRRALALVALATVSSCTDRGPGPQGKKIDPSYVRENLIVEVPADVQRVDVSLGGKVTYVGSRVLGQDGKPTNKVAPGGTVRVVHYWQVTEPVGAGWRIFRYARGSEGMADFQHFQPTDMERGHPVAAWKAGQIIQDTQDIVLRPDWRSSTATLFVGLVADGKHQLGDRMATEPASGPAVVDRAVVARVLEVDVSKAPPPLGTVHVPHAVGEIVIDGIASEPGWAMSAMSTEFLTADGSPEPVGKAVAKMTWDERNLYVFVQISDTDIYSQYKTHDDPIWKQDVVELFIDADGNRRGYVELQVNPNNTTFDSWFATTRAQPGDESWTSNMQTAVRVRGTADKAGDADIGWDVEIAIPHEAVKGRDDTMNVRIPPQVGDKWRLNVVRVDYRSNGGNPGVSSWNRIGYGDFHALDRMLHVIFADTTGSVVPKPPRPAPDGEGSAAGSAAPAEQGSAAGSAAPAKQGSAAGSAAPAEQGSAAAPTAAPPTLSPASRAVPPPPAPSTSAPSTP